MRSTSAYLVLILAAACQAARAQEVSRVAEIVVEETEEIKALTERRESPHSKTVVTRAEIEELGGQSAADVLRRMPRIYFSGPPAVNKDIRQAGLDKEFQNVLINGNRPPGGGEKREFALDRIPVESIERIEILKNPTAEYDSDSIAGLVNVILRQPPSKARLSVSAGGSRNDLADKNGGKAALSYGNTAGALGFSAGASRSDDYRGKDKSVRDSVKNEREAELETVRTLTSSLDLGFSWDPGRGTKLTLTPQLLGQREEKVKSRDVYNLLTGARKSRVLEDETKDMLFQSYGLGAERKFKGGSVLKAALLYSRNDEDKDKRSDNYNAALAFTKTAFETESKLDLETVASADYSLPLSGPAGGNHLLSGGFKRRDKDRVVSKYLYEVNAAGVKSVKSTPNDSYVVDEEITAFYLMDQAELGDSLTLTPGLRVELTDGAYRTAAGTSAAGNFTDWNPSLHARLRLGRGWQARGSFARTIGRPAFKDKVPTRSEKPDKIEEGNPELKAAASLNYEAGLEKFLGKSGVLAAGVFYKDVRDIVEKQQVGTESGKPVVKPVNVSEAAVRGLELELKTGLGFIGLERFSLSSGYSLLDSAVKDPVTGQERKLKDQPDSIGSAILRYESVKGAFTASVGANYIGEKKDETDPAKKKRERAFTQWDLSLKQRLFGGLSLYGSVTNIFNESKLKTEPGRRERESVGRTAFLWLRYEL
ncbi:MAG: TonB-dependent receptor [Elusimicrobia bacterium]|nr:TonB-dependent receptor [Elusimicrobiota bacterium]